MQDSAWVLERVRSLNALALEALDRGERRLYKRLAWKSQFVSKFHRDPSPEEIEAAWSEP